MHAARLADERRSRLAVQYRLDDGALVIEPAAVRFVVTLLDIERMPLDRSDSG